MPNSVRKSGTARAAQALTVDEHNRAPLYHQIFEILRGRIHGGAYSEGDYLPGEYELAQIYKVSRITAVRALNELAAAGLVVRERGRGTRVPFVSAATVVRGPTEGAAADGARKKVLADNVIGVAWDDLHARKQWSARILSFDYVQAPPEVARALGMAAKTRVQRAVRVLSFEGKAWNYLTTYVPADIGKAWTAADLEGAALVALLERSGLTIARIEERVTATLADSDSGGQLDIAAGTPLIKINRTAFESGGRAVEHVVALYPPDRYQYAVSLTRQKRSIRGRTGWASDRTTSRLATEL